MWLFIIPLKFFSFDLLPLLARVFQEPQKIFIFTMEQRVTHFIYFYYRTTSIKTLLKTVLKASLGFIFRDVDQRP